MGSRVGSSRSAGDLERRPALGLRRDELFAAAFDAARLFHARSWSRFRVGVLPQLDSAEQPFDVADDLHVRRRLEADELGVAAANVKPVVVERSLEILGRLAQPLVPPFLALLEQHPMAQLVLVSLALVERMMSEFEMDAIAVDENHRAHASAERDDQFYTVSRDTAEALYVGIAGNPHRAFQRAPQLLLERKIVPSLAQVGRGIDDAVLGHGRGYHRDPI